MALAVPLMDTALRAPNLKPILNHRRYRLPRYSSRVRSRSAQPAQQGAAADQELVEDD
jgi:hypothetical protein